QAAGGSGTPGEIVARYQEQANVGYTQIYSDFTVSEFGTSTRYWTDAPDGKTLSNPVDTDSQDDRWRVRYVDSGKLTIEPFGRSSSTLDRQPGWQIAGAGDIDAIDPLTDGPDGADRRISGPSTFVTALNSDTSALDLTGTTNHDNIEVGTVDYPVAGDWDSLLDLNVDDDDGSTSALDDDQDLRFKEGDWERLHVGDDNRIDFLDEIATAPSENDYSAFNLPATNGITSASLTNWLGQYDQVETRIKYIGAETFNDGNYSLTISSGDVYYVGARAKNDSDAGWTYLARTYIDDDDGSGSSLGSEEDLKSPSVWSKTITSINGTSGLSVPGSLYKEGEWTTLKATDTNMMWVLTDLGDGLDLGTSGTKG
ncbi:MAG TPA: hypothetical protein PLV92_28560, partial [Pirellulaceae bacterium]|nr:hypothetical protein [Pirellulaceae bacterium]